MSKSSSKKAEAIYAKAAALDPKDALPLLALGDFYVLTQQFDNAVSTYKKAVALKPEMGLTKLLDLTLRQNKLDDAARYVEEFLKTKEAKTTGKYWRGRLALAKGQPGEAIPLLQDAVHDQPTLASAHYYLGLALLVNNNLPSAKMSFSEAIKLTPNLAEAHLALIRLQCQARNFDQALAAAQLVPDAPARQSRRLSGGR